jgi:hypothetical protein
MTEMCRFDFKSVCVAVFDRSSAVMSDPNGDWIADRGLDKTFAKSRRRKFFWMRRNADAGEQTTSRSNDFSSENILLPASRQRRVPTSHSKAFSQAFAARKKQAPTASAGISLYKSVTNPSCKRS